MKPSYGKQKSFITIRYELFTEIEVLFIVSCLNSNVGTSGNLNLSCNVNNAIFISLKELFSHWRWAWENSYLHFSFAELIRSLNIPVKLLFPSLDTENEAMG